MLSPALPAFLLPETTVREDGSGPVLELQRNTPEKVLLTLGVTHTLEQESLDLAILASVDGENWESKPLFAFPQKFYCGNYQVVLDLKRFPPVKFLRARWQVNRWGKGDLKPLFEIYLFAEAVPVMDLVAVGASA